MIYTSEHKYKIRFNSIEDVISFNNESCKFCGDVILSLGTLDLDAKSIVGLFSLDLSKTYDLEIISTVEEELNLFVEKISELGLVV